MPFFRLQPHVALLKSSASELATRRHLLLSRFHAATALQVTRRTSARNAAEAAST